MPWKKHQPFHRHNRQRHVCNLIKAKDLPSLSFPLGLPWDERLTRECNTKGSNSKIQTRNLKTSSLNTKRPRMSTPKMNRGLKPFFKVASVAFCGLFATCRTRMTYSFSTHLFFNYSYPLMLVSLARGPDYAISLCFWELSMRNARVSRNRPSFSLRFWSNWTSWLPPFIIRSIEGISLTTCSSWIDPWISACT